VASAEPGTVYLLLYFDISIGLLFAVMTDDGCVTLLFEQGDFEYSTEID